MAHIRTLVVALLMSTGCAIASAAVTWVCALSGDAMNLVCAAEADAAGLDVANLTPRLVVNGTTFPLNPLDVYVVPLFSVPTDMEMLDQLAREAMCLASVGCKVEYATRYLGRPIPESLRMQLAALR